MKNQKVKADNGKIQLGLFPVEAIKWGSKGMEYGIQKYYRGSYAEVETERYMHAALRHLYSCQKDTGWDFSVIDEESGLPCIVQAMLNLAFIVTLSDRQWDFK